MTPQRIQLRRTKGWRKPEGAIVVARPSRWGNPFKVGANHMVAAPHGAGDDPQPRIIVFRLDAALAVELYRRWVVQAFSVWTVRAALAGHDLACWCPLDQPCHADVLLEVANG